MSKKALFKLGKIVLGSGVYENFGMSDVQIALIRHQTGDWGNLISDKEKINNDEALKKGLKLISVYEVNGQRLIITTRADRSKTTVSLA